MTKVNGKNKKKKREFPNAFTVLFIVLIIASALTFLIPAGLYEKLSYNPDSNTFDITDTENKVTSIQATQQELDKLHIAIPIEKFKSGDINKPIAIPDTYKRIPQKPQGIKAFLESPIQGVVDTADIIIFVLLIGGNIGLLNKTGTFDAGIAALSKKTKNKEFILVAIVFLLITIGGTTFGMAEETIALYPILMPIFIASGYDAMVAIAAIYMGSSVGTMFSTVNPFAAIIASTSAGINFKSGLPIRFVSLVLCSILTLFFIYRYAKKVQKNPQLSIVSDEMPLVRKKFNLDAMDNSAVPEFTTKRKLMLLVFALGFPIMIYGDYSLGWWFTEMSVIFMVTGFLIMLLSGMKETEAIDTFMYGAADLLQVALVIGVARGINIILDNGCISDTMLYYASNLVKGMNGVVFSIVQMVLFTILGIFIPSTSGLAVLAMPIFAPLADTVHLGRDVIVSAYAYGQGWMAFITPTGLILPTLQMAGITYNKWMKWIMPYMIFLAIFAAIMLGVQTIF